MPTPPVRPSTFTALLHQHSAVEATAKAGQARVGELKGAIAQRGIVRIDRSPGAQVGRGLDLIERSGLTGYGELELSIGGEPG